MTDLYSFDSYSGFLVPPCLTFPQAPCDPGRSDFPSPVLASALAHFQAGAFPGDARLKHWPAYTPACSGLLLLLPCVNEYGTYPALCLGAVPIHGRRVPRAPLPGSGATRAWVSSRDTSEGITPPSSLLRAHAPDQPTPALFGSPYSAGLRRLLPVPAEDWPFPTLSLQSLHRCLDLYHGMPFWCNRPFLPRKLQPQHKPTYFGTSNIPPQCNFTGEPLLEAAVIS